MRHDSHYVEELARSNRSVGKIIPINKIEPNPDQPRTEIGDLSELTASIKEKGILEPLLVKPRNNGTYLIIAGERRWRAANLAGLREVPCIEFDFDESEIAEVALIENMQRKDLTIWEEADGLAALSEKYNHTHEQIAQKLGKSRSTVTETLTIAGLPDEIRNKCRDSAINAKSTLLEIARQFDEEAMHKFLDKISDKNLSVKKVQAIARPTKPKTDKVQTVIEKDISESADKNSFRYKSVDNDFTLELSFTDAEPFSRKDVLRALKEVFDSVKSNATKQSKF
jgi:ParB family chromosome partitioning protein